MQGIKQNITNNLSFFIDSLLNSYSQIFFSSYKPFAILILLVSFIDVYTGLMGLLAVLTTSVTAFTFNLDKATISKGLYGFNALLVGLGLGIYYALSWHLVFIVVLAGIFTLLISISLQGIIGKYHLPYLSIPFLISIWTFTIATKQFEALGISERGIYTMNELYVVGGHSLVNIYEYFNAANIPPFIKGYFVSLSAILFQYNVLVGFLISVGLLFFSRIAFSLSLIGFFIAYLFYNSIEANITMIEYSYIGFNYILTSIAIGGFFLVPSTRSYLSVIVLVPLVAILSISFSSIFLYFNLAIYSLPFNIIVMLFLYSLKYRVNYNQKLSEVVYQYNKPEKNLYTYINHQERYKHQQYVALKLPFMGAWEVSQGFNGEHTHQGDYRYAWDFIICNKSGSQFKNDGYVLEDYFCFNKPVIAPAEGVIEEVLDGIDDNLIGEVNIKQNWGNTIIIKHSDYTYTKLCHLKKDSIAVQKGDKVSFGQAIARCGNSGRSPYPHLHFQVQPHPYIGSITMYTPISSYLKINDKNKLVKSYAVPQQNELISNTENHSLLENAFYFVPGQSLSFAVKGHKNTQKLKWQIAINPNNETYFYCTETKAKAYFISDSEAFVFTYYEGPKEALLYNLFLGIFKVRKSYYKDNTVRDSIPVFYNYPSVYLWFYDFISPFARLVKTAFTINYSSKDDVFETTQISLDSTCSNKLVKKTISKSSCKIDIGKSGIEQICFYKKNQEVYLEPIKEVDEA